MMEYTKRAGFIPDIDSQYEMNFTMQSPGGNPASLTYAPKGIIRSPFTDLAGIPLQPSGAREIRDTIEIRPEFTAGLTDLDGFSRIILIYAVLRCHG